MQINQITVIHDNEQLYKDLACRLKLACWAKWTIVNDRDYESEIITCLKSFIEKEIYLQAKNPHKVVWDEDLHKWVDTYFLHVVLGLEEKILNIILDGVKRYRAVKNLCEGFIQPFLITGFGLRVFRLKEWQEKYVQKAVSAWTESNPQKKGKTWEQELKNFVTTYLPEGWKDSCRHFKPMFHHESNTFIVRRWYIQYDQ